MKTSEMFGVSVASITMNQTLDIVTEAIAQNQQIHHTVINAGKVVLMQKNKEIMLCQS